MARTKGSGWGSGAMLWQKCPVCGKKRALYVWSLHKFRCTACKEYFDDETGLLLRQDYPISVCKINEHEFDGVNNGFIHKCKKCGIEKI